MPFLKMKHAPMAGIIMKSRAPDHKAEGGDVDSDHSAGQLACASDLLRAIEAKDIKGIADALYDAFTIMENMPHEESSEPHSYDAQNRLAGEE